MNEYRIVKRDGRVVLPPTGEPGQYEEASVWNDSEVNMRRFATLHGVRDELDAGLVTTAVLVRHAQNRYNPNAISISLPAETGGTPKKRHLGYLRERYLNWVGQDTLAALIDHAGGEVDVTVIVSGPEDLQVDLPPGPHLGAAVRDFLEPHGIEVSGGPAWNVPTPPKVHTHSGKARDTVRTLKLITAPQTARTSLTGLSVATRRTFDRNVRTFALFDADSGRHVGSVASGLLKLIDERDRDDVLRLLASEGIPARDPVVDPAVAEDGTWPTNHVPNAWVFQRSGVYDLRARDPKDPTSRESFAIYNPTTDVLWVEDSHLLAPALRCFHRMGIDPARVGLPKKAWNLEGETSRMSISDPDRYREESAGHPRPQVFAEHTQVLPNGILLDEVTWLDDLPETQELAPDFALFEKHVRSRRRLFPQHETTGQIDPCRLCGHPAATFTTPISTRELTYCQTCLEAASDGLVEDRLRAGMALRAISDLEFDSQPMLETQLATLHVNPAEPVEPHVLDQLLLLRFAVSRKRVAWTLLLEAAGFAENGLRTGRGTLIRSRDGHLCLSMREKAVCDFLHLHDVAHEREPLYPRDPDYNPTGLRRADWILSDGTLIELWGLPNQPEYAAKMVAKRNLAERHGLRLVELYDSDLPNLPIIFEPWIPAGARSGWTWSPLLIATAQAAAKSRKAPQGLGDNRGRNEFNAATRLERLGRCAEAVRLQAEGLSRAEIAERMGTGADGVKILLRDGRFYAAPTSDPARHDLATQAKAARDRRETKSQFQADQGLTTPKAAEAWRDAGVLFETSPETQTET